MTGKCIDILAQGAIDCKSLVTHHFQLKDISKVFLTLLKKRWSLSKWYSLRIDTSGLLCLSCCSMKAALLDGVDKIVLKEVATPTIKPGSILLKILACGVCGSDLRILSSGNNRVKYPAIIGHEIVGEVVAIGEGVSGFSNGDRLAVGADVPCGECVWCTSGNGNCCDVNYAMGYQFSGGYAEYCLLEPLVVSHGAAEKVPE